jgi:peptidoglycan DL-endopeptidase CwlO
MLRALILGCVALGIAAPATAASAAPSPEEIRQQIQQSSSQLTRVVEDFNKSNVELTATRKAIADTNVKLGPLQAEYDAAAMAVGELAIDAYTTGQFATLNALLTSGSTGSLLDRASTLEQVARVRNAEVDKVLAARDQLQQEKSRLDALLVRQTATQKALADKKTTIEKDLQRLYALRQQAFGSPTEAAPSGPPPVAPAVSGRAGAVVQFAYGALGKPYVFAASGPNGYDCSGLTQAAWQKAGVNLTHLAAAQYRETARLSRAQLAPGDLVFYSNLGHVALYVGNNQVIHSPQPGEVVKIASVDMMRPYGYGRPR